MRAYRFDGTTYDTTTKTYTIHEKLYEKVPEVRKAIATFIDDDEHMECRPETIYVYLVRDGKNWKSIKADGEDFFMYRFYLARNFILFFALFATIGAMIA